MRAGKLDRWISIQVSTPTRDPDSGEEIENWSTLVSLWAEELAGSGRESFQAQQMVARRTTRLRIRYVTGFNEKARVQHDSLTWNILNIAPIGRRKGLELLVEAVNP